MDRQNHLSLFRELLALEPSMYYWCYDDDGQLIASSCMEETVFAPIFRHSGCLKYALSTHADEPMILTSPSNMTWAAVWEPDIRPGRLHVIGPCFAFGLSPRLMEQARRMISSTARTESYKKRLLAGIERTPTIPMTVLWRYAVMLGYCVTGQRISPDRLHQQSRTDIANPKAAVSSDWANIYQAERLLLQMVRDGDPDGAAAFNHAANIAFPQPYVSDPMSQVQISYAILTSLCIRAAIEGGLSPEQAYSVGNDYICRLFLTKTLSEATALGNKMYREFIRSVHTNRSNPGLSREIQNCCDYIEAHIKEPLTLDMLADRLGYTKYYLSRRFKAETGCTVNNYIQNTRVERAKTLLRCTQYSVAKIAEELCFASASHFSTVFRRMTGESPAQYRTNHP